MKEERNVWSFGHTGQNSSPPISLGKLQATLMLPERSGVTSRRLGSAGVKSKCHLLTGQKLDVEEDKVRSR